MWPIEHYYLEWLYNRQSGRTYLSGIVRKPLIGPVAEVSK